MQGVIGGIPLAGANIPLPEIGIKTLSVQLPGIEVGPGCQLVTFGADTGNIEEDLIRLTYW